MGTLTEASLGSGIRVAATPIRRKKRRSSSRATPKPQYADAVWYSFQNGAPLEVPVRPTAVADTVRKLKRAARYLERTHGDEVRVQISVEEFTPEELAIDPKLANKSKVKFLGHAPFMLGRRISQARAADLGAEPEAPVPAAPRHRRTVAATRGSHAKTALQHAVVRAVITADNPAPASGSGVVVYPPAPSLNPGVPGRCVIVMKPIDFLHHTTRGCEEFSLA